MFKIQQWFKRLRTTKSVPGIFRGRVFTRDARPLASEKVLADVDFGGSGSTLVAGDFALSAGWGSTASISAVSGRDGCFAITVASAGTGQGSSPTITFTFNAGAFGGATPVALCLRADAVSPAGALTWVESATTLVITFIGTPVAASSYKIRVFMAHP